MVPSEPNPAAKHQRNRTVRSFAMLGVGLIIGGLLASCSQSDSQTPAVPHARGVSADIQTARLVDLTINNQVIKIELAPQAAPVAVDNFLNLASSGFYDNTGCHRLITSGIHILQCGDPTGTGYGGPGYSFGPIENAPADGLYKRGIIAMARTGQPDSMGSQFFFVYQDSNIPHDSTGGYTVFGRVTSGLEVIEAVADEGVEAGTTSPVSPVIIQGVEIS